MITMETKIKLAKCPFCGGEADLGYEFADDVGNYNSNFYQGYVCCTNCGAKTGLVGIPNDCLDKDDKPDYDSRIFRLIAALWNNREPRKAIMRIEGDTDGI